MKRRSKESGGKRPASGQKGHNGQGRKLKDNPDLIVFFQLGQCPDCGHNLRQVEAEEIVRRQVEDIPPIQTVVKACQMEVKACPGGAVCWQADSCEQQHGLENGPLVKALGVYLYAYQRVRIQISSFTTWMANNGIKRLENELRYDKCEQSTLPSGTKLACFKALLLCRLLPLQLAVNIQSNCCPDRYRWSHP